MMNWRTRFEDLVDELQAHPDLEVNKAELGAPATDAVIEQASELVPFELPEQIIAFYRQMNGAMIQWRHRDPAWRQFGAEGTIGLFDLGGVFGTNWGGAEHYYKSWVPFDWYEGEHYAGFDPEEPSLWWVYDTDDDGRPMHIDFETYLEALLETRGYRHWQDMFLYDAEYASRLGATVEQAEGRMQAVLPRIFDDFDIEKVGNSSELAPADISALPDL